MFVNTQQRVRRRAASGLDIRFGMQRTTRTLRGLILCIAPCVSSCMRIRNSTGPEGSHRYSHGTPMTSQLPSVTVCIDEKFIRN